ncbi:type II toxin-antitoxin system RelB/DinJ family antitoxin [Streptococcus sp. zg-JUN1979]|uniref:type II toxin-antitoxin system RelB/DinJ family antitoxin n=1 Tax=Streptococcus sp. zg-JUN1979 TaxID=3391450 RepID=UPI0039B05FB9
MTTVTFKVDDNLKEEVSKLYKSMGLDLSSALRLFMKQSLISQSIPFEIKADKLSSIIDDVENDNNMSETFSDIKSLMESLNA